MKKVWLVADSIVSPLGNSVEENFEALTVGRSGVRKITDPAFGEHPIFLSLLNIEPQANDDTRFEMLCIRTLQQLFAQAKVDTDRTLLILSTTKGNIELLGRSESGNERIKLHHTAALLAHRFGINKHTVISNACVSGTMAMLIGKRFLDSGIYENVIVLGADVVSPFIVKGFESLHALSDQPCRPFDARRNGINLGEAAAAVLLTTAPEKTGVATNIYLAGGATSNDANHISGPSRTGEELALAIRSALTDAKTSVTEIDFISSHGTATIYNDEMESKAFYLTGLHDTPLNSLKAMYGHTLGASALLESLISAESLRRNELIASAGFGEIGVSQPLNIIRKTERKNVQTCLKTASGFGGCNAVIVLRKSEI